MHHHLRAILDATASGGDAFARVEAQASRAATHHTSGRPPTEAQKLAGNYKLGRLWLHGLPIRIENPRGSYRTGTSADGKAWSTRMAHNYGYFAGTRGADGDGVDVFVGPFPESTQTWVINQRSKGGSFDEHKVMLGFTGEQQARDGYLHSYDRGWTGLMSIVPASITQLKWWLKHGAMARPLTPEQLPFEGTPMLDSVRWNAAAEPSMPIHTLMYGLRRADAGDNLLLDAVTMDDLMGDPDVTAKVVLDALVVEVGRMQQMTQVLRVMEAAAGAVKPSGFVISDPVRARGVLQVAVLFQMSDGQTVSIWLHNPDTTPGKLTPMDELISWKWMLNKKDITIWVAPERGRDLNVREVARRIMRLVERNAEAFARTNAKAAEREALIKGLDDEIAELETELAGLQYKLEVAAVAGDDLERRNPGVLAAKLAAITELGAARERAQAAADLVDQVTGKTLEAILNEGDDLMHDIRDLKGSLVQGRQSWAAWQAAHPVADLATGESNVVPLIQPLAAEALPDDAPEPVLPAEVTVPAPEPAAAPVLEIWRAESFDPTTPAGFAAVTGNPAAEEWLEDTLDAFFQERLIEVRNSLRALGWDGPKYKAISKNGWTFAPEYRYGAAGAANVVGVTHKIVGDGDSVPTFADDLTKSPEALAVDIDGAAAPAVAADAQTPPAPASLADVPTTILAELTGMEVLSLLRTIDDEGDAISPERQVFDAAREYFRQEVQGRTYANPSLGDVTVNGKVTWGKVKQGLTYNLLRVKLLAAIPALLKKGFHVGTNALDKERSDGAQAFHHLVGWVKVGEASVEVGVSVAEMERGRFMYNLSDSPSALLAKKQSRVVTLGKGPTDSALDSAGVPTEDNVTLAPAETDVKPVDFVMDSVDGAQSGSGLNFYVLRIVGANGVESVDDEPDTTRGHGGDTPVESLSAQAKVDAAYLFVNATDRFKAYVAETVNQTEQSMFATAKAMDEQAQALGGAIAWDVDEVPALDSVAHAMSALEETLATVENNQPINAAEGNADQAALEGDVAASVKEALEVLAAHEEQPEPEPVLDAVEGRIAVVGRITQGDELKGRAVIEGDGKAMVFTGAEGMDQSDRVKSASAVDGEILPARWSDDDAPQMVLWLLAPEAPVAVAPVVVEEVVVPSGEVVAEAPTVVVAPDALGDDQAAQVREALIAHGWKVMDYVDDVARTIGGGITGGPVNPDGDRRFFAKVRGSDFVATWGDDVMASVTLNPTLPAADLAQQLDDLVSLQDPRSVPAKPPASPPDPEPAAAAAAATAPVASLPDEAKAADVAYLGSLIAGTIDLFDTGILERIEPMFSAYEADAEMMHLLNKAAFAYSDQATKAAREATE